MLTSNSAFPSAKLANTLTRLVNRNVLKKASSASCSGLDIVESSHFSLVMPRYQYSDFVPRAMGWSLRFVYRRG